MTRKTNLFIVFVISSSVSNLLLGALPPSQLTKEERLWSKLSIAAQKDLTSVETIKLMNEFMGSYPSHPKMPNVHYLYPEKEFQEGRFEKAAVGFEKFLTLYPQYAMADSATYRLGECYYNTKAYNSAYDIFERLTKNYKNSALMPAALEQMAMLQMRFGEWGKADEVFNRIQSQYPEYWAKPRVRENHGIVQYYLGDYTDSAQLLNDVEEGKGAFYRGLSLFTLRLYEDAVAALKNVSSDEGSPYLQPSAYLKAEGFFQKKNYNIAAREFTSFIKRFPKHVMASYAELRKAACALLVNDSSGALEGVDLAERGNPPFEVQIYGKFIRGAALMDQKKYTPAIQMFSRVAQRHEYPDLAATALIRKAWAHRNLNEMAEFKKTLKVIEEKYPSSPQMALARFLQGVDAMERESWEEAGSRFESCVLEFPYSSLSEAGLGLKSLAYTKANRLDHLVTAATSALKLFEDNYSSESLYWRAPSYYYIGRAYFHLGQFKSAVPNFEKVTQKYSEHPLAPHSQLMLAWSLIEAGDSEKARERVRVLLDNKNTAKILRDNADYLFAISFFNEKNYNRAITELDDFIKSHPDHELTNKARYLIGLSYYQNKIFGSAIKEWDKLISKAPDHPLSQDAYLHIGDLYFRSGEYKQAAEFFREFRQKWPKSKYSEVAFWQELQSYFNGKDDETAIKHFPVYMERYPQSENMANAKGQLEIIYYRRGSHGEPKKLEEFLTHYPKSPFASAARFKLGDMAMEQKKWDRAIIEMEQFARDYPGDKLFIDALYGLGLAYENAGDEEKALVQYKNIMEQFSAKPNAVDAAFRLGSLHFKKENYKEAVQAFEFAATKKQSDKVRANTYYNIALCYENLGELEKAADAHLKFSTITEDKAQIRESTLTSGLLYKKTEKFPQAIATFKKLIGRSGLPEMDLQAVNLLAECYRQLNKMTDAKKTYEMLVGLGPASNDLRVAGLAQLAYLYEQDKDFQKALRVYEKISASGGKKEWVKAAQQRMEVLTKNLNALP